MKGLCAVAAQDLDERRAPRDGKAKAGRGRLQSHALGVAPSVGAVATAAPGLSISGMGKPPGELASSSLQGWRRVQDAQKAKAVGSPGH